MRNKKGILENYEKQIWGNIDDRPLWVGKDVKIYFPAHQTKVSTKEDFNTHVDTMTHSVDTISLFLQSPLPSPQIGFYGNVDEKYAKALHQEQPLLMADVAMAQFPSSGDQTWASDKKPQLKDVHPDPW